MDTLYICFPTTSEIEFLMGVNQLVFLNDTPVYFTFLNSSANLKAKLLPNILILNIFLIFFTTNKSVVLPTKQDFMAPEKMVQQHFHVRIG